MEIIDPAMLQKASDDAQNADVFAVLGKPRTKPRVTIVAVVVEIARIAGGKAARDQTLEVGQRARWRTVHWLASHIRVWLTSHPSVSSSSTHSSMHAIDRSHGSWSGGLAQPKKPGSSSLRGAEAPLHGGQRSGGVEE